MRVRWVLFVASLACSSACGKGAGSAEGAKADVDSDPLALLPSGSVFLARLDARAIYASKTAGAPIAGLIDSFLPLDDDAGFHPSKDIDRIVVAGYGLTALDVAAVLQGRFDPEGIDRTQQTNTGAGIARGRYDGFATFDLGSTMLAPLTRRTMIAGTPDSVRRVLDRVQDGKLEAPAPWIREALTSDWAKVALIADFAAQPLGAASVGPVRVPWLQGMRALRALADFEPPGMKVRARLSYADPEQARTAAEGLRLVDGWLRVFAPLVGGVRLQNLDVTTQASDLACTFAVDEETLRMALSLIPRLKHTPYQ
ncbi:MAG TPA: hypothetical protein VGY54_22935 [Polyangiaceae bacterium]|nr:hypothetical protein [Polyangiaceae bacterium]